MNALVTGRTRARVPFLRSAETRHLLVGVDFSEASRAALQRASELSRLLGLGMRVMHVLPPHRAEGPHARTSTDRRSAASTIQSWASFEGGLVLGESELQVEVGEVCDVLRREAASDDVALLVVGRAHDRDLRPDGVVRRLLRTTPKTMLVARRGRSQGEVVAATDCVRLNLPVLCEARALATALDAKVTAVHNVNPDVARSSRFARSLPRSVELMKLVVAQRLDRLHAVVGVEPLITEQLDAAAGVLSVARARAAQLIVLGAKPASPNPQEGGTAERIVIHSRRSVMLVPLEG